MIVEAHILCYNEQDILPYTLRHYQSFCDRVIVHDLGSTDDSVRIAMNTEAQIHHCPCDGVFDDRLNQRIKNTCWQNTDADWVIVADTDELVFFPCGSFATLSAYDSQEIPIVKTHGFEMFSDTYPTTEKQIYDEVNDGAPDDKWYGKPTLFSPKRVRTLSFSMGAHNVHEAFAHDGTRLSNPTACAEPPAYLLHFHHIGGLQRIARRYDENYKRQCENNHRCNFGNQKPGIVHANEKRAAILSKLRRVIDQ
jgi:hypothetical protein